MVGSRGALVCVAVTLVAVGGCVPLTAESEAAPEVAPAPTAGAEEPPPDPGPALTNPVVAAFRETLRGLLSDEETAGLDDVDYSDTMGGDSQRLRYIAADHTIRRILPLALEAHHHEVLDQHAALLRNLPPLLNRDTDAIATPIVRNAVLALRVLLAGGRPTPPPGSQPRPTTTTAPGGAASPGSPPPPMMPEPLLEGENTLSVAASEADIRAEADYAEAMAEYTEAYAAAFGVDGVRADAAAAAASDAIDAALTIHTTITDWGADRTQVVQEAVQTLSHMADAARRRERMPRLRRQPPEDDDPGAATGATGAP